MGCLKNILKIVVIVLAVIGFHSLGGVDFVKEKVNAYLNPPQEVLMEKAKSIADFSELPSEFEIDKAASMFGYHGVLAGHNATGQKMVVLDSGAKSFLTQADFENNELEHKLENLADKLKYQYVTVQNIEIKRKGNITALGKRNPYAMFEADVSKLPFDKVQGMISVSKNEKGESVVLISVNEKDKYSQIIAQEFFKSLK